MTYLNKCMSKTKIYPIWEKSCDQSIKTHDGKLWVISDLIARVKELKLKPKKLKLKHISLYNIVFKCEDSYEFMQHVNHVKHSGKKPIILSHRGQILDGSHRICKAILKGKKTIMCYKLPYDVRPTN